MHSALILHMQQRRTDISGLLQYLYNSWTNIVPESEIDLVTVPSSMKCRQLLVNLLERLDASNSPTSLLAYESKVEIVSDSSDSPPEAISFSLKEALQTSSIKP